jgi:two-component sensor histidine kinase
MLKRVRAYLAATIRGQAPGWVGALLIGTFASIVALLARLTIEMFVSGVVAFALVYPAVAGATLVGGARAGLIAIAVCQTFIWYFLLPATNSFRFATPGDAVSLVLATLAQLVIVWAIARYQQAAARLAQSEARRAEDFRVALRELDHRTMNNFQLAAAVLRSQSRHSVQPDVAATLAAAVDRLLVLAALHRNLDYGQGTLERRSLAPLLEEVVGALRGHIANDAVTIATDFADVVITHDTALRLGLIANELVTNALKHAFPCGGGHVDVRVATDGPWLVLDVADNGAGLPASPRAGSGSSLVELLAKSIGATISRRSPEHPSGARPSEPGTLVSVRFPLAMDGADANGLLRDA